MCSDNPFCVFSLYHPDVWWYESIFICILAILILILWNIFSGLLPIISQIGFSLFLLIFRCSWYILKNDHFSRRYMADIFLHFGLFILLLVSFSEQKLLLVANIISLSFIELDIFCSLFKKRIFISPQYLKNIKKKC